MYHLCSAHHVPEVMRGKHITKGYRYNYTWQMCIKSIIRAHNETLNVWTHLIGFLIFAGLLIHTIYYAVDEAPVPIFPSTNFPTLQNMADMAQKYYGHETLHTSSHPRPLPTCYNYTRFSNLTHFSTFPAVSSHASHTNPPPFSFFNFTSFPSFCNFTNFPHLPASPFFNFAAFPSFFSNNSQCAANASHAEEHEYHPCADAFHAVQHTCAHTLHTLQSHMQHAVRSKTAELKKFLTHCREHVETKMHKLHDSLDVYLKEMEKSAQEFSDNTHASMDKLSERLSEMQTHFNEKLAKFFSPKSKLPIMIFLFSGMTCFLGSAVYHTFGCQSEGHCAFFLKIDYSGISTLIAGSLVPFVWYVFHGLTHWQCFYVVTLIVLAALVLYVSFSEQFSSEAYQPYRALCFVLMATFAIVPFLHMVFLYGTIEFHAFQRAALSALLYVLAVAAYVSRVPERLFPGKCDFLLQSHQVFHTFIVAAALVWYSFALRLLDSSTYIN